MKLYKDQDGAVGPIIRPRNSTTTAYTGTAGTSAAHQSEVLRVISTTDCFIQIGANPTATTADIFLPAYSVEYFQANAGDKVSAIQLNSGGTLYVTGAQ